MGQFIIKDGVLKKYAADPGDTEAVIPDSVTSIRRRAFEGCHSLTSIVIPDTVTCIGQGKFSGCHSLTSITIPERVTRCVPDDMFYACPNIAVIKLHPVSMRCTGISLRSCPTSAPTMSLLCIRP